MMKTLLLPPLIAATLAIQPVRTIVDADAYAVYNVLIPADSFVHDARPTEILIQDTTEVSNRLSRGCLPNGPGLVGPWVEALNDFKIQQPAPKYLDRQFSLAVPYRFESRDAIQSFFVQAGPRGWEAFYAAYPKAKGYLILSAVGFDKAHEHAIVYMTHSCGGLCGEGGYHFLVRTPTAWEQVRLNVSTCFWIS